MCRSIEGLHHEKTMSFMEFWISSNKNVGPGFFKILGLKLYMFGIWSDPNCVINIGALQ